MPLLNKRDLVAWAVIAQQASLFGPASRVHAGTDVKANTDAANTVQNEVRIAHDFFHNALVMAYNDNSGGIPNMPLGISFSMDGGLTWNDRQLSFPPDPYSPPGSTFGSTFDPFISFGPPDNVYAGYIARPTTSPSPGNGAASGIYIERTVDGGATWTGPTAIATDPGGSGAGYRFNDRPTMHTNPFGHVAVTWIKDVGLNQPTSDIYFASSPPPPTPPMPGMPFPPTGLNFSVPVTVNDNPNGTDFANVPDVKMHPSGSTYVAWINVDVTVADATTATIKLDRTTIPGPPIFGTDTNVITIDPLPKHLSTSAGSADEVRAGSYPAIALDEADGTGQTIYMAYAATPQPFAGDESNIYFIKSTDGGMNWSAALRLNDDTTMTDQLHPAISYQQTGGGNGVIVVVWYDKRNCANDNKWDVYMTRSTNGGASFSSNRLVTDQTFATPLAIAQVNMNPPPPLLPPEPWMGEYLGLTIDQGAMAHLAFMSSRFDINGDVYYDRVPNNAVKPADLDNSGAVNTLDLLKIINSWGPCTPCQSCVADIDKSGAVGVPDLLAAINQWG